MTRDDRRAEWEQVRAERAAARRALVTSLDEVEARARDPFGLKKAWQRNPMLFAGVAAGAGALLVGLLAPGRRTSAADGASEPPKAPNPLLDVLRSTLLRVAAPWIAGFVAEHLSGRQGADPEDDAAAPPA